MKDPDNEDIYESTKLLPLPGIYAFTQTTLSFNGATRETLYYEIENAFMNLNMESIALHRLTIVAEGMDIHRAWKERRTTRLRTLTVSRDEWDGHVRAGRMVQLIPLEASMTFSLPRIKNLPMLGECLADIFAVQPMVFHGVTLRHEPKGGYGRVMREIKRREQPILPFELATHEMKLMEKFMGVPAATFLNTTTQPE